MSRVGGGGIQVPCPGGGVGTLACDLSNDLDILLPPPVDRHAPVKTSSLRNFAGDNYRANVSHATIWVPLSIVNVKYLLL